MESTLPNTVSNHVMKSDVITFCEYILMFAYSLVTSMIYYFILLRVPSVHLLLILLLLQIQHTWHWNEIFPNFLLPKERETQIWTLSLSTSCTKSIVDLNLYHLVLALLTRKLHGIICHCVLKCSMPLEMTLMIGSVYTRNPSLSFFLETYYKLVQTLNFVHSEGF